MSDGRADDANGTENTGRSELRTTRRAVLAMAGIGSLAGCLSIIGGQDETNGRSGVDVSGDLDMKNNDVTNVSDISMSTGQPTLQTPGTGNAELAIRDTAAEEWSMRATEGAAGAPGAVEFNSPVRGPPADGTAVPSLKVDGALDADELSVESWNVIDVSAHVEPDSNDDLGAFIQNHISQSDISGAIYYLPSGTYTWNTAVTAGSFEIFGIVGKPQATVKCTNTELPYFLGLGANEPGHAEQFIARNITFDVQTPDVAASAIVVSVDDYLEIDNCTLTGELDRIVSPYYSIRPTLLTSSGQGVVRVRMTDGSFYDPDLDEQNHPMGIAIEREHSGYLVIENSDVEGFINNGIYSAGHNGKVAIRNTTVKNCGAGMLRVGDGDYAYKCELINDDAADLGYTYAAVWVAEADHAVVNGIEINARQRTPAELVRVNSDTDHCTLTNFTINSEANQYVLEFTGSDPEIGQIVTKNWTIRDTGSASSNALLGRITRPNVVIENWDLNIDPADNGKRHGLVIDAPWVTVEGCSFSHSEGGPDLLLDDGADYVRIKDCDFKSGTLYQYGRATVESAIVADNRFIDGTQLVGDQVDWTASGPGFE